MLYLAELQKKTGFIGGAKAELKLLAYQRGDQSWNPVQGDEVIPAEEANNFNANVLVLADLNPNRQVQRIQEAGRPLSSILQNFSRQLEKSKSLEEEIEQWKQSLTFQSQELNRRNLEMEARLEQLEQMEEEFLKLEAQKQELDSGQETVKQLKEEIERNRKELEGAWEHLKGEQRRLEEQQAQLQQSTTLDEATAQAIQESLERLSNNVAPTSALQEQLNLSFEMVATGQGILDQHWQQREQQSLTAAEHEKEVSTVAAALENSFNEWLQAQNSLEQALSELKVQTKELNSKQEYAQILSLHVRNQEYVYQQVGRISQIYGRVNIAHKVNLEAVENMPLDQLQQLVQSLSRDFQNASHFVHEQEEELNSQQETIEKLQGKLNQVDEHERAYLEKQLAEEQDSFQFLNETLLGQHQNLQERKDILNQHQAMLWRRQGNGELIIEDKNIDLGLILTQMQIARLQQTEQLQKLEQQIQECKDRVEQASKMVESQTHVQEMKRQELHNLEHKLLSLRAVASESWGRVNLYEQMLQPVQDNLQQMRSKLEEIASMLATVQQGSENQLQAITQMRSTLLEGLGAGG